MSNDSGGLKTVKNGVLVVMFTKKKNRKWLFWASKDKKGGIHVD